MPASIHIVWITRTPAVASCRKRETYVEFVVTPGLGREGPVDFRRPLEVIGIINVGKSSKTHSDYTRRIRGELLRTRHLRKRHASKQQ